MWRGGLYDVLRWAFVSGVLTAPRTVLAVTTGPGPCAGDVGKASEPTRAWLRRLLPFGPAYEADRGEVAERVRRLELHLAAERFADEDDEGEHFYLPESQAQLTVRAGDHDRDPSDVVVELWRWTESPNEALRALVTRLATAGIVFPRFGGADED